MLFIDGDEIVEVAGHRRHGNVTGDDIETCELWSISRQDGQLNLAGHLQLNIDCLQLLSYLLVRRTEHEVGTDARFHNGFRERLMNIVYGSDFESFRLVVSSCLPCKKDYGDISRFRICF